MLKVGNMNTESFFNFLKNNVTCSNVTIYKQKAKKLGTKNSELKNGYAKIWKKLKRRLAWETTLQPRKCKNFENIQFKNLPIHRQYFFGINAA